MTFAKRTNWDLRPNDLAEALAKHRTSGKPLIDLTISNPTECGFEYDTEAILNALRNPAALRYEPDPKGMRSAREAVAGYYADRGDRVSPDDIFLTTSTSEAYSWVFRLLCDPGDEVLIPSPGYPLFDFLADINDVKLVRYPLFYDHGWHYDTHALEQAISPRTRAVMVVHPNNPTGNYCKPGEMRRLNEICLTHGLAIVADEVFLDYAIDGQRRASFVTNGESGGSGSGGSGDGRGRGGPLTFTLSGLSKICGLPQMKVAWVVASGPEQEKSEGMARLEMISDTYLSLNAPIQLAVPGLLRSRKRLQDLILSRVRQNLQLLAKSRSALYSTYDVEAGWTVVVQAVSEQIQPQNSLQLGILVHDGAFYCLPKNCAVISSLVKADKLAEALRLWF